MFLSWYNNFQANNNNVTAPNTIENELAQKIIFYIVNHVEVSKKADTPIVFLLTFRWIYAIKKFLSKCFQDKWF